MIEVTAMVAPEMLVEIEADAIIASEMNQRPAIRRAQLAVSAW